MLKPISTKCNPLLKAANELKTCINHVTPQSCENIEKAANKKILEICMQDKEQLKSIYTNLDPKTEHQLNKMLEPIRTKCNLFKVERTENVRRCESKELKMRKGDGQLSIRPAIM